MNNNIYHKLPPYQGTKHILVYNQSVGDIMQGILATHNQHKLAYDKISSSFLKSTPYQTGKCIWDFLKKNTYYVVESDNKQTLRSPSAILYLGSNPKIGLDCKSYSLFIGGILDSLNRKGANINWTYRFASYKPFDKLPHHVFVVINPNTSNEIWVDDVLASYNLHKSYTYKIDQKPMALIAMAGIGRISKKSAKKSILNKIKKGGKLLIKFNPATITARNSFLLLLKLNVFNLSRKLYKVQRKDPKKLKQFWEKIGGDYRKLALAIGQGAKSKPQFSGIGFAPVVAGAVATATPIILKFKSLLKELGITDEQIDKVSKGLVKKFTDKAIDKIADKQSYPNTEITPEPPNFNPGNEEASGLESESSDSSDSSDNSIEGVMRKYNGQMQYSNLRNRKFTRKTNIGNFA
jgi:hypothetical protein